MYSQLFKEIFHVINNLSLYKIVKTEKNEIFQKIGLDLRQSFLLLVQLANCYQSM